jgi:hypothetical protein
MYLEGNHRAFPALPDGKDLARRGSVGILARTPGISRRRSGNICRLIETTALPSVQSSASVALNQSHGASSRETISPGSPRRNARRARTHGAFGCSPRSAKRLEMTSKPQRTSWKGSATHVSRLGNPLRLSCAFLTCRLTERSNAQLQVQSATLVPGQRLPRPHKGGVVPEESTSQSCYSRETSLSPVLRHRVRNLVRERQRGCHTRSRSSHEFLHTRPSLTQGHTLWNSLGVDTMI